MGPKNDPFLGHFWGPFWDPFLSPYGQNPTLETIKPQKGGPKRGPKMDPKMGPKMAQNGSFWAILGLYTGIYRENRGIWPYMALYRPKMAQNGHFWGFWHLGPRGPQNAPKSVINMAQEAKMAKKGHFGPSLAWDPGFRGFDPYFRGWPKRHAETTGNGQKGVKIGSKYGPK